MGEGGCGAHQDLDRAEGAAGAGGGGCRTRHQLKRGTFGVCCRKGESALKNAAKMPGMNEVSLSKKNL
jgi:hypothetical protein